jgi:hypothetical protein
MLGFISYLLADIVGIVIGLLLYDWVKGFNWLKIHKKFVKFLAREKKRKAKKKIAGRIKGNDCY